MSSPTNTLNNHQGPYFHCSCDLPKAEFCKSFRLPPFRSIFAWCRCNAPQRGPWRWTTFCNAAFLCHSQETLAFFRSVQNPWGKNWAIPICRMSLEIPKKTILFTLQWVNIVFVAITNKTATCRDFYFEGPRLNGFEWDIIMMPGYCFFQ